jgi:hypothetical protein
MPLHVRACPRVGGEHDWIGDPVEALDDVPEAGLEHVGLAVDRRHDIAPRRVRDRVALAGSGSEAHARVGHHVAHDVELAGHALDAQVRGRPLVRAEEVRGDRVDLDPRVLLGHREVSAAQARLDVCERDAGRRRRPSARKRRVRIPVDEDHARALALQDRPQVLLHRQRIRGVEVEPVPRLLDAELFEEDGRQLPVVVLSRVDHHLVESSGAERGREGSALHELRPVADDGDDLHLRRLTGGSCSLGGAPSSGDAWMTLSTTL